MAFEVFISYAHEDQAYRKELDKHLSNLKRQQLISAWYDGDIAPGTEWQPQIMHHLNTAQIILLLISADFMASDFCYSIEMTQASPGTRPTRPASFPSSCVPRIGKALHSPESRRCRKTANLSPGGPHMTMRLRMLYRAFARQSKT